MNILILGGTGYIGTVLTYYLSNNNINVFPKGTTFYKSERISDINNVKNFINNNNISHLIDLTRFTARSLVGFYHLIKEINNNIVYIHLNSYSLIDPYVYYGCKFDKLEIDISRKIDLYLSNHNFNYYSFITPLIVKNINNFEVSDISAIKTNYTYVCDESSFSYFILKIINTKESGIYEVPAIKRKFR